MLIKVALIGAGISEVVVARGGSREKFKGGYCKAAAEGSEERREVVISIRAKRGKFIHLHFSAV